MRKYCIICETKISRGRANGISSNKVHRGKGWVTCSPKCSRIYGRIANYNRVKFRNQKTKQVEELKKKAKENAMGYLGYGQKIIPLMLLYAIIDKIFKEKK